MKCPQCNQNLNIPDYAILNMESYGRSVTVKTNCCGKLVIMSPVMTYRADIYNGPNTEDDWGHPVK